MRDWTAAVIVVSFALLLAAMRPELGPTLSRDEIKQCVQQIAISRGLQPDDIHAIGWKTLDEIACRESLK